MNILVVAATPQEIAITTQCFAAQKQAYKNGKVHTLITGVGLVNTTYALLKYVLKNKPDLVIQAGIAGSFSSFCTLGSVYIVDEEIFGDTGVEEQNQFKDIFDLQLAANRFPFSDKRLVNPHAAILNKIKLNRVRAVSVNQITTNTGRIHQLIQKYNAQIESMEGAAFHYVCLQENIPFVQLRAVSNFVGERNKSKWLIKEAIENLNKEIAFLLGIA
jgi:futalosine hydrolase